MKKPNSSKKKTTPEEKIKSDHRNMVREVFNRTGFLRISGLSDREFTYNGQKTDFDDVYIYENILVLLEYTTASTANISGHLKPKKIVYDKIQKSVADFVDFYCGISEPLKSALLSKYDPSEVRASIVYCSRYDLDASLKSNVPNPIYLDYPELRYFKNLADCIRKSAQFELLEFLGYSENEIGHDGKIETSKKSESYSGSLLPESSSNFAPGYKVVSFYAAPTVLLRCAYVLRNGGWRQSYNLYQRMISKTKIDSTRKYLKVHKRVFVNNVIATLPGDTNIVDEKGRTIDHTKINSTKPVTIQIPDRINSIGIIDGQHRTYAYHESVNDDIEIAKLRKKQNLLVTGIIYPDNVTSDEREKFEAKLFLEINSTQTNAKSNLKQAIASILDPFSAESIATRVLDALDRSSGPLGSQIERYFFDTDKLKTTSIVSYALKPLVKTSGSDSLFFLWKERSEKPTDEIKDSATLDAYVSFCVGEINMILSAFKANLPKDRWTTDKSVEGRMLNTTSINSILICLRLLIQNGKAKGFDYYKDKLKKIGSLNFKDYHSSQYKSLAGAIYEKFFA